MNFILALVFLIIFLTFLIKSEKFQIKYISKSLIVTAFVVKLIAAASFYYIYTYYYTDRSQTDMYKYYDDAVVMHSAFDNDKASYFKMVFNVKSDTEYIKQNYYSQMNNWYRNIEDIVGNDNRTMIRFSALFMLFTFGTFFSVKLFFIFLAFIGLFLIFKTLQPDNQLKSLLLFAAVFFMPSLVFWTSSISKEALLVFSIGGFVFFLKKIITESSRKIINFCFLIFFTFLLFNVKMYVLLALLPFLTAMFLSKFIRINSFFVHALTLVLFITAFWNFHLIMPQYNFVQTFIHKQHDFIAYSIMVDAGSYFEINKLEPTFISFISAIPNALYSVFFRPFIFGNNNILMYAAGFENLVLAIFCIISFLFYDKKFRPVNAFWTKLFFAFFLLIIIGVSTPVSGAIVRYKIIAYPFLVSAILTFVNIENLSNFTTSIFKKLFKKEINE